MLQVALNTTLESHHNNLAISKLNIKPNYPEFGSEVRYISKIIKEISPIYGRLMNQNKFKHQTVFSARFDKQAEDNQVLDETEIFIILNINHNLTKNELDKIDNKSLSKRQIQAQEIKNSGWKFVKNKSMAVYFSKTGEMNVPRYV